MWVARKARSYISSEGLEWTLLRCLREPSISRLKALAYDW